MRAPEFHVLGVDTSLRSTGFGVVSITGNKVSALDYGVLATPASRPHTDCLRNISQGISSLLERWQPAAVSIEGAFFSKNAKTAMILGEARGTVIANCACQGIEVFEYAPRRVKQAVVGFGGAGKEQVRSMMRTILCITGDLPEDSADALALAVCHAHCRSGHAALMPKPI